MMVQDKYSHPIPASYFTAPSARGRIERVAYQTQDYADSQKVQDKYLYVYLPAGFEAGQDLNILYLIHGGGGTADSFFETLDDTSRLKCVLDNLIADGRMPPMLVVTPTYYPMENTDKTVPYAHIACERFPKELADDIIPLVEGRYLPCPQGTAPQALPAYRDRRAVGGFSMGAVTTWFVMMQIPQLFRSYLPLSGDCWAFERRSSVTRPKETAQVLISCLQKVGLMPDDIFIYAATGSDDIAWDAEEALLTAMGEYPDWFRFLPVEEGGNTRYLCKPGGVHTYDDIREYIYTTLPDLFRK